MSDCPECKESLLSNQTSNFGDPKCADECPADVNCEGIITSSDCVTVNAALPCIDSSVGDVLTDVLEALDDKVCEAVGGTVKVSVSEPDTCPGYLEDKIIAGDGITITKNPTGAGCQTLTIAEKCWEFNNFGVTSNTGTGNYRNKWVNVGGVYEIGGYSNIKECSVRLRGFVENATVPKGFLNSYTIGVLPVAFKPLLVRVFSVTVFSSSIVGFFKPGWITVDPTTGNISLTFDNNIPNDYSTVRVSFDGISWETN